MGMACCACFYGLIRPHLKGDDAAQYSMILWATMWIIVVSITIFLFWVGEKGKTLKLGTLDDASFAQDVNTFAQIAGILVAATMIVVTNRPAMPDKRMKPPVLKSIKRWN
jgi:hypothetical protein